MPALRVNCGTGDQRFDGGLSIPRQLAASRMRIIARRVEHTFSVSVDGALHTHFREQHWSAVFCSIDQHLNRQSPFRRIAFRLREFPNIIAGISQCSCRPLTGQGDRLIERAFPGHDATPRQNRDSNRGGRIRSVRHPSLPPASPSEFDFSAGRHRTALRAQNAPAVLLSHDGAHLN